MPMRNVRAIIVAAALLICTVPVLAQSESLAITGATIFDGTGAQPLRDGVVLISGNRIVSVGPARSVKIPEQARRLDAGGKFIVPGLMDANIHLNFIIALETLIKYEDRYDEIALEAAQVALKNGLTTVFDTCGQRAALVRTRDRIAAGETPGSRIYLAGYILGLSSPLGADFRPSSILNFVSKTFADRIKNRWEEGVGPELMWMTPEQVRPIVRDYTHKDVNFLKYASSGHGAWPEVMFSYIAFSPRVQKAVVEEGHAAGLPVQAHTTSVESLDIAIDAGVDIVTHGDVTGTTTPIPAETLRKLVQRHIPVSVIPVTQNYLDTELQVVRRNPPRVGNAWPQFQELAKLNRKSMIRAGVTLLLSTDASLANPVLVAESGRSPVDPDSIGEGHFNALVALEEEGMSAPEILKTATINIAKAYRVDKDLGTLETGKIADLLILERNPMESARNYRSIQVVVKDGKVVDRDALPVAPLITARSR